MAHADPLHEHEWRASENMPPLSREDMISIAVAALGTAAVIGDRHRQRRRASTAITDR